MKAKIILAVALALLLIILFIQNTGVVTFRIYFWTISLSQIIMVPIIALAGFLIGYVVASLSKKDRDKQL